MRNERNHRCNFELSDAVDDESHENEVKPNSLFRKTDSESTSRDLDLDSIINGKSFPDGMNIVCMNPEM